MSVPADRAPLAQAVAPARTPEVSRPVRLDGPWVPVAACLWIALVLLLRWPPWQAAIGSDSTLDSSFFAFAGELVRNGGTPYLTFWDHKAPLIFLLNAAALTVSAGQLWGPWLLTLLTFTIATVLAHEFMKRSFGAPAALLGTAFFAFSLAALMPTNLTEGYVLPLQWAAAFLVLRSDAVLRGPLRAGIVLGVVGALAFFLRPNLIGAAACTGLVLAATMLAQRRVREMALFAAATLAGAAAVAGVLALYLAASGALAAFWEQAFRYNFVYANVEMRPRVSAAHAGFSLVTRYGSAVIVLAGWALCAMRLWKTRRDLSAAPVLLLAVIWLPVELALASMSGRAYGHYFSTLLAPIAVLAAAFATTLPRAPLPGALSSAVPLPHLLATALAIWAATGTVADLTANKGERERAAQVAAAADYVRAETPNTATLLVWGHAAEVHLLSGRRPASRFVYPLPLLTPGYADPSLVNGFLEELQNSPPALILDATPQSAPGENLVPALAAWNPDWHYPADARPGRRWWSMTPELRRFYDWVHANYIPTDTVGPRQWVVYRKVTPQKISTASGRTP